MKSLSENESNKWNNSETRREFC